MPKKNVRRNISDTDSVSTVSTNSEQNNNHSIFLISEEDNIIIQKVKELINFNYNDQINEMNNDEKDLYIRNSMNFMQDLSEITKINEKDYLINTDKAYKDYSDLPDYIKENISLLAALSEEEDSFKVNDRIIPMYVHSMKRYFYTESPNKKAGNKVTKSFYDIKNGVNKVVEAIKNSYINKFDDTNKL